MRRSSIRVLVAVVCVALVGLSADVLARKGPPAGGEAGNNLSFPVIFSDSVRPDGWVDVATWTFAAITDPTTECVGEDDITPGTAVPLDKLCYYGRKNLGLDEVTGQPVLEGDPCPSPDCKLWWLQERVQNKWQAPNMVDPDTTTPVVITAVDWGDLLESTNSLSQKQVRTEMTLLQLVSPDGEFASLYDNYDAHNMSGAVPGTDQSINEVQGTDWPDTETLISARSVKGYDATVYSRCARLLIQKIPSGGTLTWSSASGWTGTGVVGVLDINAYSSTYSAEINAGGSLIYGYNWNTKTASAGSGLYRITFVIDGPSRGCYASNTVFDSTTVIANPGNLNFATLVPQGDPALNGGDEGGLTYVDVTLKVTGRR